VEVESYDCGCILFPPLDGHPGARLVRCTLHEELNKAIMTRERVHTKDVAAALPIGSTTYFSRVLEESRQLLQIAALKREELREEIRQTRARVTLLRRALESSQVSQ
jgi:hypothetical protein